MTNDQTDKLWEDFGAANENLILAIDRVLADSRARIESAAVPVYEKFADVMTIPELTAYRAHLKAFEENLAKREETVGLLLKALELEALKKEAQ